MKQSKPLKRSSKAMKRTGFKRVSRKMEKIYNEVYQPKVDKDQKAIWLESDNPNVTKAIGYKIIKKRKPLRHRSVKRSKEERLYAKLRKEYLEENDQCYIALRYFHKPNGFKKILSGCTIAATQIHHKVGREGKWLNYTKYWMACCDSCHKYIEKHREESYKRGWLIRDSLELREEGNRIV